MSDRRLVRKKLAFIEANVRELRKTARPELIPKDVREQRFVAYTLQICIQAAIDAASIIVSIERLGEPETNKDMFDLLVQAGWLPEKLLEPCRGMVGFRNVVVHGYAKVDPRRIRQILETDLDDLLGFVKAIRKRLGQR